MYMLSRLHATLQQQGFQGLKHTTAKGLNARSCNQESGQGWPVGLWVCLLWCNYCLCLFLAILSVFCLLSNPLPGSFVCCDPGLSICLVDPPPIKRQTKQQTPPPFIVCLVTYYFISVSWLYLLWWDRERVNILRVGAYV